MDMNYNSVGAEILLINNRTASGTTSMIQYRTNSVVEGLNAEYKKQIETK